jgi:hypothetical protein
MATEPQNLNNTALAHILHVDPWRRSTQDANFLAATLQQHTAQPSKHESIMLT